MIAGMADQQGKIPSESAVEARHLVMPSQANPQGTAFGGAIVGWIDMVAAMAAQRPIRIGDHVVLKAAVNYVSRSSMEVGVRVTRENPFTGEVRIATTAHLTFVALDDQKKPTPAPPLLPQSPEEKQRYEHAKARVKARKELLKNLSSD